MLRNQLRPAVTITLLMCVVTGLVYPGVVTALAQTLFPHQANGSLVRVDGRVVGSALIGQPFTRTGYFRPRPSAAGKGYDATSSGGTNKGPTDSTLAATIRARIDSAVAGGAVAGAVPSDMVTASASGLDPHISPANAWLQVSRVARSRGVDSARVRALLDAHTEGRQLGLFGEPRVNVLLLNVAIDSAFGAQPGTNVLPRSQTERHADSTKSVRFGGFVDGYYAWDIGQPPTRDRSFAGGTLFGTQPARHNEFNVNLAFIDATLDAPRYRGRLALQYGTSVQANYAGEPVDGVVSGPGVQQFLQEAYGGIKVGARTWVDAGVFFSNMGMEGFISRDNPVYTRSLVADYSPYYSSGVRVTHQITDKLRARLDVVNGWQNISENNDGKAIGARIDWTPSTGANRATTVSYFNFLSEEAGTRTRVFNGVGTTIVRGPVTLMGEADVGAQRRAVGTDGWSSWYGLTAVGRVQVAERTALVARLERYADRDQVILATGATAPGTRPVPNPAFRGSGASLGVDVQAGPGAMWRTEFRGFRNRDPLFPDGETGAPRRAGGFAVTSLAVTF